MKCPCCNQEIEVGYLHNPKGIVYNELIDLAFEICDEFILVVRNELKLNVNANQVLKKLQPSFKKVKEQFEWPGTMCFGEKPAKVHYYNTDNYAKEILKYESNSLHDWVQPNLPEDLSFIKNNHPWLVNTSHENESYILTENKKEIDKIMKIEGLKVIF